MRTSSRMRSGSSPVMLARASSADPASRVAYPRCSTESRIVSRTTGSSSTIRTRARPGAVLMAGTEGSRGGRAARERSRLDGQGDGEPGAPIHLALHRDLAPQELDQAPGHRQQQAGSRELAGTPRGDQEEWLEELRLLV